MHRPHRRVHWAVFANEAFEEVHSPFDLAGLTQDATLRVSQGFPGPTQHPRLVAGNKEVKLLVTLACGFFKESAALPIAKERLKRLLSPCPQ